MSAGTTSSRNWDSPETCPFCGGQLTDAGAGFIDHIGEHPSCDDQFQNWRSMVGGDMGGEWSG